MDYYEYEQGIANSRPPKLTKSAKKANLRAVPHYEEVNVLVTGFGAVDDLIKFNPSWAVAKSLPPALVANAAHPSRIRIVVHPEPVPNVYDSVLKLTPQLFENRSSVHLVLHLSTALDNRNYYSLERGALKPAYTQPDDHGQRVMPSRQPEYWVRQPDILRSSSAFNDALIRWRNAVPSSEMRMSDRANHHVAAYQFYTSLAHVKQAGSQVPWKERTMVAAVTLPNKTSAEDIEEGKKVVIGLIYALIDSRRFRDGDYHELPDSMGNLVPVDDDE